MASSNDLPGQHVANHGQQLFDVGGLVADNITNHPPPPPPLTSLLERRNAGARQRPMPNEAANAQLLSEAFHRLNSLESGISQGLNHLWKSYAFFLNCHSRAQSVRELLATIGDSFDNFVQPPTIILSTEDPPNADLLTTNPPLREETPPVENVATSPPSRHATLAAETPATNPPSRKATPPADISATSHQSRHAAPPTDLSATSRPSTNHQSSIDLSRDSRPGAKTGLKAQNPSASQAPNVHSSPRPGDRKISARAYGPVDMIPGIGAEHNVNRLLPLDRIKMPKGDIMGLPYNCEANCGYPDHATVSLIQCESTYHKRQPQVKQIDGTMSERGWYHNPCGKLAPGQEPDGWICPTCVRRGTTSTTDDEDGDDDDDDDDDGGDDRRRDGEEDSEDEFDAGRHTPSQDSDDDSEGDDAGDEDFQGDDAEDEEVKGDDAEDEEVKGDDAEDEEFEGDHDYLDTNQDGKKRPYILDGRNDADDIQQGESSNPQRDQKQPDDSDGEDDGSDGDTAQKPAVVKTNASDPWLEVERELTIKYMKQVGAEGTIKGEKRFEAAASRLRKKGYNRHWTAVKNQWNRGLREKSGYDERRNKNAPMTTSKQDAETKRKNKEKKEQMGQRGTRLLSGSPAVSPRNVSPSGQSVLPGNPAVSSRNVSPRGQRVLPGNPAVSSRNVSPNRQSHSSGNPTVSTRNVSPKRERVSDEDEDEDEEEIIPAKRRRAAPHRLDYFPGLN